MSQIIKNILFSIINKTSLFLISNSSKIEVNVNQTKAISNINTFYINSQLSNTIMISYNIQSILS